MHTFITWLNAYPYNNFPDYTQSLLFAGIIVWIFFRQGKTSASLLRQSTPISSILFSSLSLHHPLLG